jgi:predicted ATPase
LGAGAAAIGEMIPEVLEILDGIEPAPKMEPDQARFRLFDAITGFLKRASEDSPLLLVLDDLHWADRPTLLLLEFVARQLDGNRILVAGTYRDTEAPPESPLGESLGRLSRLASFQRHPISGLPPEDIGNFVKEETGFTLPQPLLNAIHAHTEGNPFFLGEVVRYLAELGRLDDTWDNPAGSEKGTLGIPRNVRDVIGQRLIRLTGPCNQALTTASVIGREFEFNLLSALTETAGPEELLDLMDEAISARIIEHVSGGNIRYRFRHALMQGTLTEGISAGRKARLHARIGEALETAYGDRLDERAAELAHHFTQAVPVLGNGKMLRYSLLAGERALAAYAHEEEVEHFTRGLEAKGVEPESQAPAADADAAGLLLGLARAKSALFSWQPGYTEQAVANLRSAFEYYVEAGDRERAVEIAQSPLRTQVEHRAGLADVI